MMLLIPFLDILFVLSKFYQARLLMGEFWMVWLASAIYFYLVQYNYDMVFGHFRNYF